MCDKPVDNSSCRPIVCSGPLCLMSYSDLNVGVDLAAEIRSDTVVADLLISIMHAAVFGGRFELAFPKSLAEFCLPDGGPNIPVLQRTISDIPPIDDMLFHAQTNSIKAYLDSINPLLHRLLNWCFRSNRAHIRTLKKSECPFGEAFCDYTFVFLSNTHEKEQEFQDLKRKTEAQGKMGVLTGFHGSRLCNWHSIIRLGVKVMSNSKYMSTGAAHGVGAYFARDSSTSCSYCGAVQDYTWPQSKLHLRSLLGLCEIINRTEEFTSSNPYLVVPQEHYIATRYLFVNPNPASRMQASDADSIVNKKRVIAGGGGAQKGRA